MANTAHSPTQSNDQGTCNLVQGGQEGHAALFEQNGVFHVVNGEGQIQYTGDEVGAEVAYWRTTFGVPIDDSGTSYL